MKQKLKKRVLKLGQRMEFIYRWLAKKCLIKGLIIVPLVLLVAILYLHQLPTFIELVSWILLIIYWLLLSTGFTYFGNLVAKK